MGSAAPLFFLFFLPSSEIFACSSLPPAGRASKELKGYQCCGTYIRSIRQPAEGPCKTESGEGSRSTLSNNPRILNFMSSKKEKGDTDKKFLVNQGRHTGREIPRTLGRKSLGVGWGNFFFLEAEASQNWQRKKCTGPILIFLQLLPRILDPLVPVDFSWHKSRLRFPCTHLACTHPHTRHTIFTLVQRLLNLVLVILFLVRVAHDFYFKNVLK